MKLPETLKIGGKIYAVIYYDFEPGITANMGCHNQMEQTIRIASNVHPDQLRDAMLHEIIHAVMAPFPVEQRDEETWVAYVAHGLDAAFRDNPELLEIWRDDER